MHWGQFVTLGIAAFIAALIREWLARRKKSKTDA